jgi:L-threonylcarbamoyladenylate synthase
VLAAFGGGIAAPSANRFGRISATAAQHVVDEFGDGDDGGSALQLVLDGGSSDVGIESTIVDVSGVSGVLDALGERAAVLRPGGIGIDALARVLGYVPSTRTHASPRVSGDLASHYAPQTPTRRVEASRLVDEVAGAGSARFAVLARTVSRPRCSVDFIWRQAPADPAGYARALYAELRVLDAAEVDFILVESTPDEADWQAVNDRLRRATHDTESRGGMEAGQ